MINFQENSSSDLRKIFIKNSNSSNSNVQTSIKNILNQLIDELEIPANKFNNTQTDLSQSGTINSPETSSGFNYTVTYRNRFDFDDDYVNYEDFERWTNEHKAQNQVPDLK
jgi:hypothetical protein